MSLPTRRPPLSLTLLRSRDWFLSPFISCSFDDTGRGLPPYFFPICLEQPFLINQPFDSRISERLQFMMNTPRATGTIPRFVPLEGSERASVIVSSHRLFLFSKSADAKASHRGRDPCTPHHAYDRPSSSSRCSPRSSYPSSSSASSRSRSPPSSNERRTKTSRAKRSSSVPSSDSMPAVCCSAIGSGALAGG